MTALASSQLDGLPKIAFAAVSIVLVSFALYTAMFGVFPDMIQRGAHLSAVIALVYLGFLPLKTLMLEFLVLLGGASSFLY